MTRSSKPASLDSRLGMLLLLFLLVADFMVFAALLGAGIVLREGVGTWVPAPLSLALRDWMPLTAVTSGVLLIGLFAGERKAMLLPSFGLALAGIAAESFRVFSLAGGSVSFGSYAAFFLVVSGFVALHLAGGFVWLALSRRNRFEPGPLFRPFWFFTVAIGEAAILVLHWPLYS